MIAHSFLTFRGHVRPPAEARIALLALWKHVALRQKLSAEEEVG